MAIRKMIGNQRPGAGQGVLVPGVRGQQHGEWGLDRSGEFDGALREWGRLEGCGSFVTVSFDLPSRLIRFLLGGVKRMGSVASPYYFSKISLFSSSADCALFHREPRRARRRAGDSFNIPVGGLGGSAHFLVRAALPNALQHQQQKEGNDGGQQR
jgi:hypothetical protein